MWDEIIKSVKANLYERATSPLLGTYVVAWCFWNFRFLLVLVSAAPYDQKLDYIQTHFFPDYWSYTHVFGVPLATTVLLIFAYPYPARFVYWFWRVQQKKLKEIRQKIEDETPLTQEEARQLRSQLWNLQTERDNEINTRDNTIRNLKEQLQAAQDALSKKPSTSGEPSPAPPTPAERVYPFRPDDKQLEILRKIASAPNEMLPKSIIVTGSADERILAEFNIGELTSHSLIRELIDGRGGKNLMATHEGRRVLVKPEPPSGAPWPPLGAQ